MEKQLIILDVETTGFKPEEGHEIIELAASKVQGAKVLGEYYALIKPTKPVSEEATKIHGITNDELALNGRPIGEVLPEFLQFAGNDTLVGHNVAFDLGFLNHHLLANGMAALTNPTLDTLDIARRLLILPSYSLERVAAYLKVPQLDAHRAQADVATTHKVLVKLFERAQQAGVGKR